MPALAAFTEGWKRLFLPAPFLVPGLVPAVPHAPGTLIPGAEGWLNIARPQQSENSVLASPRSQASPPGVGIWPFRVP